MKGKKIEVVELNKKEEKSGLDRASWMDRNSCCGNGCF